MSDVKNHELRVTINASAAESGRAKFVAAVEAIKKSVKDLERDSAGAYVQLSKTLAGAPKRNGAAPSLQAISSASRQAEKQAASLQRQLNRTGDMRGLAQSSAALALFQNEIKDGFATTEQFRASQERLRQSLHEVKMAADSAAEVQKLRTQYQRTAASLDPLVTGQHSHRRAILSAEQAARAGAISEQQLARTLAQSEAAFLGASNSAANYDAQLARLEGSRRGWSGGQGGLHAGGMFQMDKGAARGIGMQLSQIAQVSSLQSSWEGVAKGISLQLADIGLYFGLAGMAAGGFASLALPFVIDRVSAVIPPVLNLKDSLEALDKSIDKTASTAAAMKDFDGLRESYGRVTMEVLRLVEAQNKLARLDAASDLESAQKALYRDQGGVGWMDSLRGYADTTGGRIRRLRDELSLTSEEATKLESLFQTSRGAESAAEMATSYATMRQLIIDSAGGYDALTKAQKEVVSDLTKAEDAALRFAAVDLESNIAGADSATSRWANSLQDVGGQLRSILSSLSAVGGSVVDNAAKNAEIAVLRAGGSISAGAEARKRAEAEARWSAQSMAAGSGPGAVVVHAGIALERAQFEESLRLEAELETLRKSARESEREAGESPKAAKLSEEQRATETLTKSIQGRLIALEDESRALELVTAGRYKSLEAAQMAAAVERDAAIATDAKTQAILAQIDAQTIQNENQRRAMETDLRKVSSEALQDGLRSGMAELIGGDADFEGFATKLAQTVKTRLAQALSDQLITMLFGNLFTNAGEISAHRMRQGIVSGSEAGARIFAQAIANASQSAGGGGGSGGGWEAQVMQVAFSAFTGVPMAAEGMTTNGSAQAVSTMTLASALGKLPHYSEGTPSTSRGGAQLSVLHGAEAVVPLSRGRHIPVQLSGGSDKETGGGNSISFSGGINVTVAERQKGEDDNAFAGRIAESIQDQMEALIDSKIFEAQRYGGIANPRGGR